MEKDKQTIIDQFLPQLKNFVKSETVFGEPYTVGTVTLIPVNSVKVGFGYGAGDLNKKADSAGGGGGVLLTPVAFIVIRGEDVSIHNLSSGTIENVMEKVPEVMEKFLSAFQRFQKKKNDSTD